MVFPSIYDKDDVKLDIEPLKGPDKAGIYIVNNAYDGVYNYFDEEVVKTDKQPEDTSYTNLSEQIGNK